MSIKNFFLLPIQASTQAPKIDFMIIIVHILMIVLALGWGIYLIYSLVHFRSSRQKKAIYKGFEGHISTYIEAGIVVIEAIFLLGLSLPFWNNVITKFPSKKDALTIRVIAQQYAWNIHYAGADGIFGKQNYRFINSQTNPIGLDPNDTSGLDDILTINQLVIPIDKPVIVELSSLDVIHSFGIPAMRVKQDILPGMSIPTWFEATKIGTYEIMCAQLCGIGHYRMRGLVKVKSQKDFDTWMQENIQENKNNNLSSNQDDFWS